MIIYDQLRISDNGQTMFIDAHVNKAEYFKDIHIKRITICTEDQVSETNPLAYGSDFIYQEDYTPISEYRPVYEKTQVLSEQQLLNKMNSFGGVSLEYTPISDSSSNALSIILSGKYPVLDSSYSPKLVVATNAFNPLEDNLNNDEILFTADGTIYEDKGHTVWQFKGKGNIKAYEKVNIYLYKQSSLDTFEYVRIDSTSDDEFLHCYYQVYSDVINMTYKELHLVLDKNSFNEKFNRQDLSHNMFFVYIECEGTPDPCTPCRLDEMTTLGVTFDYGVIFNKAMNYTRELANDCTIPHEFIDFILNFDALKLAIETEHYVPAIGFWNNMVGEKGILGTAGSVTKPCGCHG